MEFSGISALSRFFWTVLLGAFFSGTVYAGDTIVVNKFVSLETGAAYLGMPEYLPRLSPQSSASWRIVGSYELLYGIQKRKHVAWSFGISSVPSVREWSEFYGSYDPHNPGSHQTTTYEYYYHFRNLTGIVKLNSMFGNSRFIWGGGIKLAAGMNLRAARGWEATGNSNANTVMEVQENFDFGFTAYSGVFLTASWPIADFLELYVSPGANLWLTHSTVGFDNGSYTEVDPFLHAGVRINLHKAPGLLILPNEAFRNHPFS